MGWVKFQAHPKDLGVFLTTQSMRILLGEKIRSRKKSQLARSHTVSEMRKKSELMDQLDIIPLGTIKSSGRQSS
jgi:hypothetical protein